MQKWEYLVKTQVNCCNDEIDVLGSKGWELVSTYRRNRGVTWAIDCIFKRPIEDESIDRKAAKAASL